MCYQVTKENVSCDIMQSLIMSDHVLQNVIDKMKISLTVVLLLTFTNIQISIPWLKKNAHAYQQQCVYILHDCFFLYFWYNLSQISLNLTFTYLPQWIIHGNNQTWKIDSYLSDDTRACKNTNINIFFCIFNSWYFSTSTHRIINRNRSILPLLVIIMYVLPYI